MATLEIPMNIRTAAPSALPRQDWRPLIRALTDAAPDTWLCIPIADLPGATHMHRQINVHGAVRRNALHVQTRIEGESLFVCRIEKRSK
jgi:hypothetical protein